VKKVTFVLLAGFFAIGISACASSRAADAAHNSRNSLNWDGVYAGMIPAADGPGINVEITLYPGETYELSYQYVDRGDERYTHDGSFKWDRSGNVITLNDLESQSIPSHYRVGEDQLIQLDMKGKPITGELADNYILKKR
jgi:uncharacterized lipoprotein NlpE involved in copper resistance